MAVEEDREPLSSALSQASTPAGAVFLSYASEDAPAAERIATALRGAGIQVWFDKSELRGGDAWDRQIREQIHDCRLFIAVISAHTEGRDEGYFRREWKLAVDRTHDMDERKAFLVPVVIDSTPERGAHVPEKFRQLQWTRLPGGETPSAFVERIQRLLAPQASSASAPATTVLRNPNGQTSSRLDPRGWQSRPVLWPVGAVLAVALSYFVVDRFWLSKRATASTASPTSTSITAPEKSIAVLPFVDLSERHDQEYLADGIAEQLLDLLEKVPELKVIGRTSSFAFKGKPADVREIGRALGAMYILEGSVRRSGDQIRVTTQLLDSRDGTHRWSETFDRHTTDIFQLQDEIAARTAQALHLTIASYSVTASRTVDPSAYDEYVRGLRELADVTEASVDRALALFTQSSSLDPGFSKALVGVATARLFICDDGWKDHRNACESAKAAVDAAIKAAPRDPDAYAIRAELRTVYDWDWDAARADVRQAESLGGGELTDFAAARIAYAVGQMDRARQLLNLIISKSPFDANALLDRGYLVEYRAGQFEEAESWIRKSLQISPKIAGGHFSLAMTLLAEGKKEQALDEMRLARPDDGRPEGLAIVYHALGRNKESDEAMREAVRTEPPTELSFLARIYAYEGDHEHALAYLDKAYENRDDDLWYIKGDWLFSKLAQDPRYRAFLRKMNLPE